jgi:acyl carrier protein
MSTLETLQNILVKEFNLTREQLAPEAELKQLGVDSLDVLELMFKIEDQFGLKIKDDIPTSLVTLNDVVVYIDSLLAHQPDAHAPEVAQLNPAK